jgi:hypothetical protein
MNGKRIQLNGRKAISLVLAVLILTLAATPALAWPDKEGGKFQPPQSQVIFLDDAGRVLVSHAHAVRRAPVMSETPWLRPSLALAE